MTTCVLIVPAANKAAANDLGSVLGLGDGNYSIPLTTGTGTTHWATNVADPDEWFIELANDMQGDLPSLRLVLADTFEEAIADAGLSRVPDE